MDKKTTKHHRRRLRRWPQERLRQVKGIKPNTTVKEPLSARKVWTLMPSQGPTQSPPPLSTLGCLSQHSPSKSTSSLGGSTSVVLGRFSVSSSAMMESKKAMASATSVLNWEYFLEAAFCNGRMGQGVLRARAAWEFSECQKYGKELIFLKLNACGVWYLWGSRGKFDGQDVGLTRVLITGQRGSFKRWNTVYPQRRIESGRLLQCRQIWRPFL